MLTIKTVQAATLAAAGKLVAGGCLTARAVVLAEEAMRGIVGVSKLVGLVLAVGVVVGGAGWAEYRTSAETSRRDQAVVSRDAQRSADSVPWRAVAVDQYGDALPEGAVARLGAQRFRHSWSTSALAFTSDGRTLIGYGPSEVFLWDAANGKIRHRLAVDSGDYGAGMAISPDGTILVKCEGGYGIANQKEREVAVSLWQVESGKKIRGLSIPKWNDEDYIHMHDLCFTPDGKTIAWSNETRRKAALLDVASGQIRVSFGGEDCFVSNIAIAPNSKTLAAEVETSKNRAIELWDIESGKLIRSVYKLPPKSQTDELTAIRVAGMTFSPLGKKLAFALLLNQTAGAGDYKIHPGRGMYGVIAGLDRGDRVLLFDPATGKQLSQIEAKKMTQVTGLGFTPQLTKLIFTADGNRLLFSTNAGTAGVWDLINKNSMHTFKGYMPADGNIALSPDGKTMAQTTYASAVRLWDVASGKELFSEYTGHRSHINSFAYSPDGITLFSASGGAVSYRLPFGAKPASRAEYGRTILWDAASKRPRGSLPGAGVLTISPDGKCLAITPNASPMIRIWNVSNGNEVRGISVSKARTFESATFSADSRKLFTLDSRTFREDDPDIDAHCIRHWDLATGRVERVWNVRGSARTFEVALGPDGKTFAWVDDGEISVYDLQFDRQRVFHTPRNQYAEGPLTFSPDTRVMAFGIANRRPPSDAYDTDRFSPHSTLRFWEIVTGKEIFQLKGHEGSEPVVAWSHDGRLVGTWGLADIPLDWNTPSSVRLWDTATGKELCRFGDIKGHVTALMFAPDGKSLAVGLRDGTILTFDVAKMNLRFAPPLNLGTERLESLWSALGSDNSANAYQALAILTSGPRQAISFLSKHLKPVASADRHLIHRWITELSSGEFAVRQSAAKELEKIDEQIRVPIQNALKGNITLEVRRRLEQIVKSLPEIPSPETVRTIRAITVLERIGSPEAKAVLETLASGASGARETEEAKASLERLNARIGTLR